MRILVMGQAAFGEAVLKRLLDTGEKVVGVAAPGNSADPLRVLAEKNGISLFVTSDLKKPGQVDALAALQPELGVMAFVTDILPQRVLDLPTRGTIQYHPSLLPRHRGASAMHWAIIQGETRTGLTIFWPDKGIDTGPILLQREVEIGPDDTLGSLYFGKLFPMGVEAMAEAVALVRQASAARLAQDGSQATYEGVCKDQDAAIDWSKPAQEVYNLVRGCNPQPGASTLQRRQGLKILDSRLLLREAKGQPGMVMRIESDSFSVALKGGYLVVSKVQPRGEMKMAARDFIAAGRISTGDILGV